jgi:regulatory associated protein of mTOR
MTAVAVQQRNPQRQQYNPRQSPHSSTKSQPQTPGQSYSAGSANNTRRQTPQTPATSSSAAGSDGAVSTASSRSVINNDTRRAGGANGASTVATQSTMAFSIVNAAAVAMNGNIERRRSDVDVGLSRRNQSSSALSRRNVTHEDSEQGEVMRRRPKPLLQRAKSDYGPRGEESDDHHDSDTQDWGARHGFEDHYASEEYVSQLANVSRSFHSLSRSSRSLLHPSIAISSKG